MSMLIEAVFSVIFFGISLTGIIWRLTLKNRGNFFFEIEFWCIISEAIYYLILAVMGIINACNKTTDSCLQNFLKYTLSKLLFPPVIASPFIFYLGNNLDWFSFPIDKDDGDFWCDLINHLIAPSCLLVDVILFERKYKSSNFLDILIITGMYIAYSILYLPFQTSEVYKFVVRGKGCIICVMIVCYCISINMHYIYIIITRVRDCHTIEKDEDTKDEKKDKKK